MQNIETFTLRQAGKKSLCRVASWKRSIIPRLKAKTALDRHKLAWAACRRDAFLNFIQITFKIINERRLFERATKRVPYVDGTKGTHTFYSTSR